MQLVGCLVDCTCPTTKPSGCKNSLAGRLRRNGRNELRCLSWLHACSRAAHTRASAAPAHAGRGDGVTNTNLPPSSFLPSSLFAIAGHSHKLRPSPSPPARSSCKSCSSVFSSTMGHEELSASGSEGHELTTARSTSLVALNMAGAHHHFPHPREKDELGSNFFMSLSSSSLPAPPPSSSA
ncbi:Os08g0546500 [Oryza sativa Japonica Group]|uniref:Os08g0546500 protein n=1 Tax=Oryza sativa subsp. japonica TaxID=39947 RepID=A0A0P0XJB5_ORYSJ|nr:hypothetical protein EE612_045742 [Oryza sativa]BAT06544.1 Os08g0546500 [Oryza sativa Japonica Group]